MHSFVAERKIFDHCTDRVDGVQLNVLPCSKIEHAGGEVSEALNPEQVVARELRSWRERRGLTAQQLSDRIAQHGGKLSRQAISKIENEDRRVTLDELSSVAMALDVPPVLLTLPLGRDPMVQLAPNYTVPTWDAVKWWIGEIGREGGDDVGTAVLGYFRDHDELTRTVLYNRSAETGLAQTWGERLRDLRKNMRRAGVLPPELPAELADIEEEEGGKGIGRSDQED
jgi:transcriptional regulator with XRE-family HTH domain